VLGNGSAITHEVTLPTGQFTDLAAAASAYLQQVGQTAVRQACIAIANPIDGDLLKMTNNHWQFSIEATRQTLDLDSLLMLNDWAAMAAQSLSKELAAAPQGTRRRCRHTLSKAKASASPDAQGRRPMVPAHIASGSEAP
jgi:glucokinase